MEDNDIVYGIEDMSETDYKVFIKRKIRQTAFNDLEALKIAIVKYPKTNMKDLINPRNILSVKV